MRAPCAAFVLALMPACSAHHVAAVGDAPALDAAPRTLDAPRRSDAPGDAPRAADGGRDAGSLDAPRPDAEAGPDFRIVELGSVGCAVLEHEALTGDDRGGVAVAGDRVLVSGDRSMASFSAEDLGGGTALGVVHDAAFTDLDTEEAYVLLGTDGTEVTLAAEVAALGAIDPSTGALRPTRTPLSEPVTVLYGTGIFAGAGELVLGIPIDGELRWTRITIATGEVTWMGRTALFAHNGCETWAWWGIAERVGTTRSVAFIGPGPYDTNVWRQEIPDVGRTYRGPTPITTFTRLGDMCSFTISPSRARWYFHHEDGSQFAPGSDPGEWVGSCPVTFTR